MHGQYRIHAHTHTRVNLVRTSVPHMHAPTLRARAHALIVRGQTCNSSTSLYHTCNRTTRTKRQNRPLPYVKQFLVSLVASRRYGIAVAYARAAARSGITSVTKRERKTIREREREELEPFCNQLQLLSLRSLLYLCSSTPRASLRLSRSFSLFILSVSPAETSPEKSY